MLGKDDSKPGGVSGILVRIDETGEVALIGEVVEDFAEVVECEVVVADPARLLRCYGDTEWDSTIANKYGTGH